MVTMDFGGDPSPAAVVYYVTIVHLSQCAQNVNNKTLLLSGLKQLHIKWNQFISNVLVPI